MFIDGAESPIAAGPMSSTPIMTGKLVKGKEEYILQFIPGTAVSWLKEGGEEIEGIVIDYNKIEAFEGKGTITLPYGAEIKTADGNVFMLLDSFKTDIAYTAEDLRELNSRLYKSGFIKKDFQDKINFYKTDGLRLEIGTACGMLDGLIFSVKKPISFSFKQGGALPRIDSLVAMYDSEINRFEIKIEQGAYPEKGKAPLPYVPKQKHLGTYELTICDIYMPAYTTDISKTNITDKRNLIEDFNASDIQFADSINVIEDGQSSNMQNAICGVNKKVEKYNTEKNEADEKLNERIDMLNAKDIFFDDNIHILPEEETKPNVELAIEKLNEKIEDVKTNSGNVSEGVKEAIAEEAKKREEEDQRLAAEDAAIRTLIGGLKAVNIEVDPDSLPGLIGNFESPHIQNAIIKLFNRVKALEEKHK